MSEAATATATEAAPQSGFFGSAGGESTNATTATESSTPQHFFGEHVRGEDGSFKEGWTSALAEKFPRLANTAMRYKNEGDFFQGIDHALGLVGKKSAPYYPKADASEDEIRAFREVAGVPLRAEEYVLKPEKLPDGVAWNEETGKHFAELMHKHHIPAAAAQELVNAHLETLVKQGGEASAQSQAKVQALIQETTKTFQKEWGDGFNDRVEVNKDFISSRLKPEELNDPALQYALSHPALVRIVDEARRATREMPLPGAANSAATGSMSARQQAVEIIKANPNWRKDVELTKRVNDLYAQQAAADKRRA